MRRGPNVLNVKAVVAAFNQEKALVGAFSVITNLRMEIFEALLQASMFHLPRIVWKHLEGGLMKMLVGDFTDPLMLISKDRRLERVAFIRRYFQETTKVGLHIYISIYLHIYYPPTQGPRRLRAQLLRVRGAGAG